VHNALTGNATDLRQTGPGRREVLGQTGGDFQLAGLDPALLFFRLFWYVANQAAATTPQRGENGPKAKAMSDFSAGEPVRNSVCGA